MVSDYRQNVRQQKSCKTASQWQVFWQAISSWMCMWCNRLQWQDLLAARQTLAALLRLNVANTAVPWAKCWRLTFSLANAEQISRFPSSFLPFSLSMLERHLLMQPVLTLCESNRSPKLFGFILWGTWMSGSYFLAINQLVESFRSEPRISKVGRGEKLSQRQAMSLDELKPSSSSRGHKCQMQIFTAVNLIDV